MTLVRKFLKSGNATLRTVRFIVGTSKVVRFLWGLSVVMLVGLLYTLAACSAAQLATIQRDAYAVEPYVFQGCSVVEGIPVLAPYSDFVCAGAEAADAALAKLPTGAKVVSSSVDVKANDAGVATARTLYRIRCPKTYVSLGEVVDAMTADWPPRDAGGP